MKRTPTIYTDEKARKLFAEALELIQKNYFYKFQQIAEKQGVSRQTYLRISEREEFKQPYQVLKKAIQDNIAIAEMKLIITHRQAVLIERNFTTRWIGK
jgi:hypothetical protein